MKIIREFGSPNDLRDRVRADYCLAHMAQILFAKRDGSWFYRVARPQRVGCCLNCRDDGFVAAAAADNVIHRIANLVDARIGIFKEQCVGTHELPRRAKSALDRAMSNKCFLQRVQGTQIFSFILSFDGS